MKKLHSQLAIKLQHDENMILKILETLGDMARFQRELQARIIKLERRNK